MLAMIDAAFEAINRVLWDVTYLAVKELLRVTGFID